ncbi:MAG: magnesium transporter [Oscillospiraceae bacterium]|nr:magnesium transporter [Oscillospiraceae bacterium]
MLQETILSLMENRDIEALKAALCCAEDMEILHAFHDLSPEEQIIVFRLLTKDSALSIFEELDTDEQQNLLRSFTAEKTIEFVNELAPDDRVKLLDELPATVAKKLLASLSPEERKITNLLMGYEPETAGRIMTTEYISLKKEMTVEQALERVRRQAKDKETIYTLYITSASRKLEGVLTLKELLIADGGSKIEDIMSKQVINASTDTDQEKVAHLIQELDLLALPIVDKENRLVGIVTIDDAVDILEEEVTEDIFDQAGLADITKSETSRSEVLISGGLWAIWKVRLPFLVITLGAGMLAAFLIAGFEEALESVLAVAFFIPLIMDMGGNVGTQSSTVFARGVVLGHIHIKQFFKHFVKEIGVGFSLGVLVGLASGALAAALNVLLWDGSPMLGVAVGLALVVTMTLASLLGFLVPYMLIKFKVDQAAGSAPIITSIKDIAGLLIYFAFVSIFLGNLL